MNCPRCNEKTKVMDCLTATENTVMRRRKCLACGHSFYTEETAPADDSDLRRIFSMVKNIKYERKPISYEESKLRLIKQITGKEKQ